MTPASQSFRTLRAGAPLVLGPGVAMDASRVTLSDGIACVSADVVRGRAYRTPAFAPRAPWRIPTSAEQETIAPRAEARGTTFVGVVKIAEASLRAVHALGLGTDMPPAECHRIVHSDAAVEATSACLADLAEYVSDPRTLGALGYVVGEPGLPTVTMDPVLRAGLHVDNWDEACARADTRNRLHLNLGREPRHYLYINVPLDDALASLPEELCEEVRRAGGGRKQLGNLFLETSLDYPVVRVRIDPGEAYIAPSDDIVHDGDTTGKVLPDVNYAVLGHFSAPRA
jgi:hypothetical protein